MADIVTQHSMAELLTAKIASAFAAATAGGTGDNTAVTGLAIDRFATGALAGNVEFILAYQATLAAAATLSLKTIKIEQGDDGTNWDATAYQTFTDAVVATGKTGGSTERGALKLKVDLGSAKRFVRIDFTPDLSAANTDTASVVAVANLAGFDRLPAA